MSERRDDEDYREFLARLQQEFPPRSVPPTDPAEQPPYAAPDLERVPPTAPQPVIFSFAQARPRAVYALLVINIVMYGITMLLTSRYGGPVQIYGQLVDPFTAALVQLGAKVNDLIDAGQWWRLITPMFLHGGLIHLGFNSYALYVLGPQTESVYGTPRFLAIYGLAGLAGGIASYAFNPSALSVGASGAIFGLFGALAAFTYVSRSLVGREGTRMQLVQIATLVGINLFLGLTVPNIDNSAHVGGLIVGGLAGLALAPRYAIERRLYPPVIARRDRPAMGWTIVAGLLVALIAWFVVALEM